MNVTTEKIENHKVVLTIEVPAEELDKGIKAACKSLANRVNIPGFRKGHAPRRILEMHIGKEAIMNASSMIASLPHSRNAHRQRSYHG